jgi:hypothetical protein
MAGSLLALTAILGCASPTVTDREAYQGKPLPRPDRILVYDFAATGADLPEWSAARDRYGGRAEPRTTEEIAMGRQLGAEVAADLVAEIREMGLPVARASGQPEPKLGEYALVGYFESIDESSETKRVVIGFGSGTAQMKTQLEAYRMTDSGMRKLGSAGIDSGGGRTPGVLFPLLVTVATANPIGRDKGGDVNGGGKPSNGAAIETNARQTAHALADELRDAFRKQGWI